MDDQPHRSRLNVEDIARLSGYSRSTVSRVVNAHPNVSPRARAKILEIIEQTNFRPNHAARALASQRYMVLGVLIPHIVSDLFGDPFFPHLLQAITYQANQLGYSVTLGLMSDERDNTAFYEHMFHNGLSDGYIVASATFDDDLIEHLKAQSRPYVIVGQPPPALPDASFVDSMNYEGAFQAVQHLIERGRRRIATIPGRRGLTSTQHRLDGYRAALEAAGFPVDESLIAPHGAYTEQGGYEGMRVLLKRKVDAVFCANDVMALGAMRAINEADLRVPADIALCGFDDLKFTATTQPPLTTVRQNIDGLGSTAARGLIALLNGDQSPPFREWLPVELVVRDST